MDSLSRAEQLPAQRLDAAGRAHVDQRAVLALALPLMANSACRSVPQSHRHVVHGAHFHKASARSARCSGW